jgi:hypothetical protein
MTQLRDKRRELTAAEAALTDAVHRMDTDAVMNAKQRVEVLRGFVQTLEVASADVLEGEGVTQARVWLRRYSAKMRAANETIMAAQAAVRSLIDQAVHAIAEERAARKAVEQAAVAAEVLAARFALPVPDRRVTLPGLCDWAVPIVDATDQMRPTRSARRGLLVNRHPVSASATPEERRRATLRAVADFMDRSGSTVPNEVAAILAAAPIPPALLEAPPKPRPRTADEAMGQHLEDVNRALTSIPGAYVGTL